MGRRHKPSRWPVNWAVVGVVAVLTLAIGIAVATFSGEDKPGGIVVPTPTSQQSPELIVPSQTGPGPGIGQIPSTPPR